MANCARAHTHTHDEASIILIPSLDKKKKKKLRRKTTNQLSIMNIAVKPLNKILANQIKQCLKRIMQHSTSGMTTSLVQHLKIN